MSHNTLSLTLVNIKSTCIKFFTISCVRLSLAMTRAFEWYKRVGQLLNIYLIDSHSQLSFSFFFLSLCYILSGRSKTGQAKKKKYIPKYSFPARTTWQVKERGKKGFLMHRTSCDTHGYNSFYNDIVTTDCPNKFTIRLSALITLKL